LLKKIVESYYAYLIGYNVNKISIDKVGLKIYNNIVGVIKMRCCTISKNLKCSDCGYIFPIYRKAHKNHKTGHIKHMYCHICKNVTVHIEMSKDEIYKFQTAYSY
jgi:hypothetical protein